MTKPSVYHSQGYNCAEALIKSYKYSYRIKYIMIVL